ncbi:hypothetical protein [Adonisia turfae]|uniref:hypothetical protein n=1 Tax=Adonisia turfae TaxID=2950184 RepID=UPI002029A7D5|nr:hypothetical protein [Adonisia turfae]
MAEIKAFGDRRYKKTWIKALARLEATLYYRYCLDACNLILYDLNFTPDHPDYEYRHEILDEFLMYPDGLDLIKQGLEQIFMSTDFTADEQQEAGQNGFFELLAGRKEQLRGAGIPVGSVRQLTGVNA